MPTTVTMMMFVVVDKHVVDGHLHVDAGALLLPRLAHNIFHWGNLVFIFFLPTFSLGIGKFGFHRFYLYLPILVSNNFIIINLNTKALTFFMIKAVICLHSFSLKNELVSEF